MKVLHVIDRLQIGGAEKVFIDITSLLCDTNVKVSALIFKAGFPLDTQIDKRIELHVLNRVNKYSIAKLYKTYRICSKHNIVHVHMRHCYNYVKLAQVMFGGSYKIILHDHYGDIEINPAIPFGLKLFKPSYYIGVSKQLVEWSKTVLKVNPKYIYQLSNTIIPNKGIVYKYNSAEKKAMMVSNIRPTKNIEYAITLVKKMDWELDIYGNNGENEYFNFVNSQIQSNRRIKIIQGVTDFSKIYNTYNLAIHCAKSETGPLVLLEYLAYGIPFISYNTGEIANVVSRELPLHFMNSFDEEDWIDRIRVLMTEDGLSTKLKAVFWKYFSPEKYIEECLKIYESVNS